ncbi:hypothetical protein [Pyxidicoccus caerfyrddinensis]|uniref:hypothetical protein n=1 Tax=Pyxidicoccus caerfyrddinensis TaxID=2709663 RepID=UPI0013DA4F9A|nr:hypothetical protein [Pyxidicoccus caerfyrddinensis]
MSPRITVSPDDTDWKVAPEVPGLLLDVPHEGRWRQRPSLHIEATAHHLLRVTSGGQPLLWMRIDDWWDDGAFLRGPAPTPWRLPSFTSAEARGMPHAPATVEWWTSWAHRFVRELERADASILHAGLWGLRPLLPVPASKAASYPCIPTSRSGGPLDPPHSLEEALRFEPFWWEPWDWRMPDRYEVRSGAVLSLRQPSPPDDGRVKAWRKHARDGTLPPVLLLYFQLAGKWLVVDGHDRLHAALLEGLAPPLLGLWPVQERPVPDNPHWRAGAMQGAQAALGAGITPARVDSANELLLRSHQTHQRLAITRAWPLAGGAPAWMREVVARREQAPFPVKDPDDWEWFAGTRQR